MAKKRTGRQKAEVEARAAEAAEAARQELALQEKKRSLRSGIRVKRRNAEPELLKKASDMIRGLAAEEPAALPG